MGPEKMPAPWLEDRFTHLPTGKGKFVTLRICLITPELYPLVKGGIGAHTVVLAEGLAACGHHVVVAGFNIHEEDKVSHSWGESFSVKHLGGSAYQLGGIRGPLAVREFLRRSRGAFDVVEVSNWLGHGAFVPRSEFPYVARISSPAAECRPDTARTRRANWLEARTCRRADVILTHSVAMWKKAANLYRCGNVPHAIVPLGIPDVSASKVCPPKGLISTVYIGRAEHRKGTDVLIRALSAALPACPLLHLTIVGGDFDRYASRSEELNALWSDLKVRFPGRIKQLGVVEEEEKCRVVAESHWLVVPSRFESFGLVVIEAMRAGTPVLAADGGGLRETCAKGPGNIIYGPPEDSSALARLLQDICAKGETYALGLRSATREAYLKWYKADRFVDASLRHYEEAIALRNGNTHFGHPAITGSDESRA